MLGEVFGTRIARTWRLLSVAALVATGSVAACTDGSTDKPDEDPAIKACVAETKVDAYKELAIVDDDILDDPRAKNANNGVWSFRHAVENMTPQGTDPGDFVLSWLTHWIDIKTFNNFPLNREPREALMNQKVICPWLKRTPANACDAACGTCAARKLDLAQAPFRLIAITNRMDLRDEVEGEPSGEGRLVFATASNGAGDAPVADPKLDNLPMTLIFEYRLPDSRSLVDWAKTWHALSGFATTDEPYRAALEQVTNAFTKRGANPAGMNGSAISQVRTNESAANWIWQQREFALDRSGQLRLRGLRNTPPEELNNNHALSDWVNANRNGILSSRFEMPAPLQSGASNLQVDPSTWRLPDVDEPLRKAFAKNTCNGCHISETQSVDFAFHVSVYQRGRARLSKFVTDEELPVRTTKVQRALCEGR